MHQPFSLHVELPVENDNRCLSKYLFSKTISSLFTIVAFAQIQDPDISRWTKLPVLVLRSNVSMQFSNGAR